MAIEASVYTHRCDVCGATAQSAATSVPKDWCRVQDVDICPLHHVALIDGRSPMDPSPLRLVGWECRAPLYEPEEVAVSSLTGAGVLSEPPAEEEPLLRPSGYAARQSHPDIRETYSRRRVFWPAGSGVWQIGFGRRGGDEPEAATFPWVAFWLFTPTGDSPQEGGELEYRFASAVVEEFNCLDRELRLLRERCAEAAVEVNSIPPIRLDWGLPRAFPEKEVGASLHVVHILAPNPPREGTE